MRFIRIRRLEAVRRDLFPVGDAYAPHFGEGGGVAVRLLQVGEKGLLRRTVRSLREASRRERPATLRAPARPRQFVVGEVAEQPRLIADVLRRLRQGNLGGLHEARMERIGDAAPVVEA